MDSDFAGTSHLASAVVENPDSLIGNDIECIEDVKRGEMTCRNSSWSMIKFITRSFELSVICGILFGLFATFLWWIELNSEPYCFGKWDDIPIHMRRLGMITTAVKAIITMFWPLLTIAPICSWSMIKESNLIFLCIIAGFLDITDRCYLFTFEDYEQLWKSIVGNIVFSFISYTVFYKFAKYRQKESNNKANTIKITFKLGMQLLCGLFIFLPYNYLFLNLYPDLSLMVRTILSCSLIALFYVPKLIIRNLMTNMQGICKPDESIIFGAGFLIISNMVLRLTQAKIESLTYFTIISLVHGICNVIDKITLPLKERICQSVCRRKNDLIDQTLSLTQNYTAHQSLVNMITETSSVIMSNAAAYILVYYYKKGESTGKREEGSILFREMVIRSSIAVCIDWFFNIIALKIQNDCYKIPVVRIWKGQWKFIMIIHLIQITYVIVYFARYVNVMLLDDMIIPNSSYNCIGLFRRI